MRAAGYKQPRIRVLFLTSHLPYPAISGGRRREFELLQRVGERVEVTLCAVSKTFDEDLANSSRLIPPARQVEVFPAATDAAAGPVAPRWTVTGARRRLASSSTPCAPAGSTSSTSRAST